MTDSNGNAVRQATIGEDELKKALELLTTNEQEKPIVLTYSSSEIDEIVIPSGVWAEALAANPDALADKVLTLKSDVGSYSLPLSILTNPAVQKALGTDGDAALHIAITPVSSTQSDLVRKAAEAQGATLIGEPVSFRLLVSSGGQQTDIDNFGSLFVNRSINTDGTANQQATVVVYDEETGTLTFVPAFFQTHDGVQEAVITRNGNSVYAVLTHQASFTDVPSTHWAKSAIDTLASKFLLNGITDTTFAPDRAVTRAEFTTMLVKAMGIVPADASSTVFTDIGAQDWYASAILAANTLGLVDGFEDHSFQPNATITREQMAVMLSRALSLTKLAQTVKPAATLGFTDAASVSSWAEVSIRLATAAGLLSGNPDGSYRPQGVATRAEAATVFYNLLHKLGSVN